MPLGGIGVALNTSLVRKRFARDLPALRTTDVCLHRAMIMLLPPTSRNDRVTPRRVTTPLPIARHPVGSANTYLPMYYKYSNNLLKIKRFDRFFDIYFKLLTRLACGIVSC